MATASQQSRISPHTTTAESVRETLESIVVAFVLAFIFRAFIVEAFVIPTGSMATTLYGAQMTHTCSICGFPYAMGVPFSAQGQPLRQATKFQCPNCDTSTDPVANRDLAWYNSGDRILVHKWPFHLPWDQLGPQRWDVTVFKDPSDGVTNYIKRLVGMPGEVLEIIDGDVYAVPLDTLEKHHPKIVDELKNLRYEVSACRDFHGGASEGPILKRYNELNQKIVPLLQIQRKTPRAQKSLWFNVYNHDYLPNYAALKSGARVEWRPDGQFAETARAWNVSRREITFAGGYDEWLSLVFSGKPIDDFYAYNSDGQRRQDDERRSVGDLRLAFTWFPDGQQGGLRLQINRHLDNFIATIMGDGTVRLGQESPNRGRGRPTKEIGAVKLPPFDVGEAVRIEFVNVDYAVSLSINGDLVLQSSPEEYAPDPKHLQNLIDNRAGIVPSEVRIAARGAPCRLRHLVLERDVYYLSQPQSEQGGEGNPYLDWPGWGTEGFPMLLLDGRIDDGRKLKGEYFMCGDNSPQSKDSRLWWQIGNHLRPLGKDYQLGTVPRDQLIGKAFFVYWPSGYRQAWAGGAGIVPNFGKMRWIR